MTCEKEQPAHLLEAGWRNYLADTTGLKGPHKPSRVEEFKNKPRDPWRLDRTATPLSEVGNVR